MQPAGGGVHGKRQPWLYHFTKRWQALTVSQITWSVKSRYAPALPVLEHRLLITKRPLHKEVRQLHNYETWGSSVSQSWNQFCYILCVILLLLTSIEEGDSLIIIKNNIVQINDHKNSFFSFDLRSQFRVFTAPFHRVEFADFWLADQLNSLVFVLMDLEYLVCFYIFELQWNNSNGLLPKFKSKIQFSIYSAIHGVY